MIFERTPLEGVFAIHAEPVEDERGAFARIFSEDEFAAHGIDPHVAQCSISQNPQQGTLRGLHLQLPPHEETKLVRCTNGKIFDVAVDLREGSRTFRAHHAIDLSRQNQSALLIPPGVAHGFLTLEGDCEVQYQMSAPHVPEATVGVRWNDSDLGIVWPEIPTLMSKRDASLGQLSQYIAEHLSAPR